MVNRISTSGKYSQLVADMQKQLSNYNKLTKQLASGSKLTSITDDPIATVNVLNTNRQLGQMDTFSSNVELAKTELSALDDLMDLANGYLSDAWNKAVQANNQTYSDTSLKALKVEIDEITKTMVDLANTEYDDNYIFSGANTNTVPYIMDDNGEVANYRYVVSDGDVTGSVLRSFESSLAMDYQKKTYTGDEDTSYALQVGSVRIPLGKGKKAYSACETVMTDHQLELLPDLYLPVHLYVTRRKAYVYHPAVYSKTEAETLLKCEWDAFLEKFEQKGIPIIVKNVKIETSEKMCVIRGSVQAEVPIAKYAPTQRVSLLEQSQSDESSG